MLCYDQTLIEPTSQSEKQINTKSTQNHKPILWINIMFLELLIADTSELISDKSHDRNHLLLCVLTTLITEHIFYAITAFNDFCESHDP